MDSHLGHKSSKLEKTLATDLGRKLRKIVESVSDDDAANRMLEVCVNDCLLVTLLLGSYIKKDNERDQKK